MASLPPGLVWLASYPKSGNTWMRVLLANLGGGEDPADINALGERGAALQATWRFGDDTLVDADLLTLPELERLRVRQCDFLAGTLAAPLACKTHDRFDGSTGAPVLGTRARAAVYVLRDPRDVAVSLAHHMSCAPERAVAVMTDADYRFGGGLQVSYRLGDWSGHVTGWTEQAVLPVRAVRYEDLRRDTAGTLSGLLAFLGAAATGAEIDRAVRHSRLEELQRQEGAHGFRETMPHQERFFRSGRVGEWREVLNPALVRRIEDRFAPVMARWGYAPAG